MTISSGRIRQAFEQAVPVNATPSQRKEGLHKFVNTFRDNIGLKIGSDGTKSLTNKAAVPVSEFSLKEMAIGICGEQWYNEIGRAYDPMVQALEADVGAAAVVPGNLANVSAFVASVSGLLDARTIQGYKKPEYIIPNLIPTIPLANVRQAPMIATARIGNQAQKRNPGEPFPQAQFGDRKILPPPTTNNALACNVTYEAIYFDQTGEVMDRAYSIGNEIGLSEELQGFRVISGVINNYNYNGVAYNTYLTSGNWINDLAGNELLDWTNVNSVYELYSRFTDQETGNRITTSYDTILCSPSKMATAEHIVRTTTIETRTPTGTNDHVAIAPFQDHLGVTSKRVAASPYLDQVLTTTDTTIGLALSQTNANKYWWALNTSQDQSAFIKTQNWPFQVVTASPTDYIARNQKLALSVFADSQVQFSTREPRAVVRSKN